MIRMIGNRLMQTAVVMVVVSLAIYGLIGLMPGDPIDLMVSADPNLNSEDAARLKALYGLDQPLLSRWWHWLVNALHGDFGYSRLYASPVLDVLWPALLNTLKLIGLSLLLSLLIAIATGVIAALKPYSVRDYFINFVAFGGISIPVFWLALMMIILFAVKLQWLPAKRHWRFRRRWFLAQLTLLDFACSDIDNCQCRRLYPFYARGDVGSDAARLYSYCASQRRKYNPHGLQTCTT